MNVLSNEHLREYHAMLLYDGYLLNNWAKSRPVAIEDKHRANKEVGK